MLERRLETWLRKTFRYKEIGWPEIKEEFTRWSIVKNSRFSVYLHRLYCPNDPINCHDHPWSFLTVILARGYLEQIGDISYRRWPGMILFRRAAFSHKVTTPYGVSWSLVVTGPKNRDWSFKSCED